MCFGKCGEPFDLGTQIRTPAEWKALLALIIIRIIGEVDFCLRPVCSACFFANSTAAFQECFVMGWYDLQSFPGKFAAFLMRIFDLQAFGFTAFS